MQIAIDVANFTAGEADELRQAIGSKRSRERMERLRARFFEGMAANGIDDDTGTQIWEKLAAFANYGFPESHSISFASLVYASSWLKLHYPAAFCAALLKAQPMGFYSPHSLIQDARRHGVPTFGPCINTSAAGPDLEEIGLDRQPPSITVAGAEQIQVERYDHGWGVRLGIDSVRHISEDLAEAIDTARPFVSIEDVARRVAVEGRPIEAEALEALATAGAFDCFGLSRREALWEAGAVVQGGVGKLEGIITGVHAPQLPGMSEQEEAMADLWATGASANGHPTRFLRESLEAQGVVSARELAAIDHGTKVMVGGVVTHRQRPATASGVTFFGLEDETGLINVVVSVGCWSRYRRVARNAPALLIRGRVERQGAVVNIVAEKLEPLPVGKVPASRDFR